LTISGLPHRPHTGPISHRHRGVQRSRSDWTYHALQGCGVIHRMKTMG